jgi:hypothetical protein
LKRVHEPRTQRERELLALVAEVGRNLGRRRRMGDRREIGCRSYVAPIVGTLGMRTSDVDDRRGVSVLAYLQP